ncbi:MAG: hypothetical protein RO257_06850 [Candidatus Kapabacteria bacterium]|nr:hypothetical protein [Candidatus Kapabacteria bacterium]
MKKNRLLIIIAVFIGIGLIILSFYWPPVPSSKVAGSFTKTDKYRENTVSNSDIILNSELLADTNKTKKAIADLVQFGDFTLYVKSIISQWWIPVLEKYNNSPEINDAVASLKEFNSFIDNNNHTIQSTIIILSEFYADKNKAVTTDVESQIKQFYNYSSQFLLRDSIFEETISRIDNTVKNDNTRKKEIAALKNLRDRIVIDNFMYALTIGDTTKLIYSTSQVLNNPNLSLKLFLSEQNLGIEGFLFMFESQMIESGYTADKIQVVLNTVNAIANQYGSLFFNGQNGYFLSNQNQLNLILNQEIVGAIASGQFQNTNSLIGISAGSNANLGALMNLENLGMAQNKESLGTILLNSDKLNDFMNQTQLGMFNQSQLGLFNQSMLGIVI